MAFSLEVTNSPYSGRSCELCRLYMFDEKGAPIPKRFGKDGYESRVGKTPCETSIGCPKGHWKDRPDLTPEQKGVIDLFRSSLATGGRSLTVAESQDWFLTKIFADLLELNEKAKGDRMTNAVEQLAVAIMTR